MQDLARKLTQQPISHSTGVSGGILGSSLPNLLTTGVYDAIAPYRIGMWPIISKTDPEIAMGLASVTALLLDMIAGIRVYRLFSKLVGEPSDYRWTIERSQFSIDDWGIEGLNENAALWGSLERGESGYQLVIYLENDLDVDRTEPYEFTLVRANLRELVNDLPSVVRNIITTLTPNLTISSESADKIWYQGNISLSDERLDDHLRWAFNRDVLFLLRMWGQPWSNSDLDAEFSLLLSMLENSVEDEFSIWLISSSLNNQIKPAYSPYSTDMAEMLSQHCMSFHHDPVAAAKVGMALAREGHLPHALDLLEQTISVKADYPFAWATLARLYRSANETYSALVTYQRAIRQAGVSETVYLDYADLVQTLSNNGLTFEDFGEKNEADRIASETGEPNNPLEYIFAGNDNLMRREIVGAYEAALKLEPNSPDTVLQIVSQMLLIPDIEHDDQFWYWFKELVELDGSGEMVRTAIDSCYGFISMQRAVTVLTEFSSISPERIDLRINLISALIANEDWGRAEEELDAASSIAKDVTDKGEIERLLLVVRNPDFEAIYGELSDRINGGGSVTAGEGEFIEEILEQAPHFTAAYVLLASAYHLWGDEDDSIDVLLDSLDHAPNSSDILGKLGLYLWERGEKELGLGYLKQGLELHPNNVLLLSLTGRFLFDLGDVESAKMFLLRAESVDPYHVDLQETRRHIAQAVSGNFSRES